MVVPKPIQQTHVYVQNVSKQVSSQQLLDILSSIGVNTRAAQLTTQNVQGTNDQTHAFKFDNALEAQQFAQQVNALNQKFQDVQQNLRAVIM